MIYIDRINYYLIISAYFLMRFNLSNDYKIMFYTFLLIRQE